MCPSSQTASNAAKVGAFKRTLKLCCFPAIGHGDFDTLEDVGAAVDTWVKWHNEVRAHKGHVNRELPPTAFYALWLKTTGGRLEKLIQLGVLKIHEQWAIRLMGDPGATKFTKGNCPAVSRQFLDENGLPHAFVLQRNGDGKRRLMIRDSQKYLPRYAPHGGADTKTGEMTPPSNKRPIFQK